MKTGKHGLFLDTIIFLLILLFIYASISKMMDFELFKAQLSKSPLIMSYASIIVWIVPGIEIAISMALLIPRLQLPALFAAYSLMFTFTMYIAFILTFSPYVPCSCGGILNSMGWTEHLIFNIVFTILPVIGIYCYNHRTSIQFDNTESRFKKAVQL